MSWRARRRVPRECRLGRTCGRLVRDGDSGKTADGAAHAHFSSAQYWFFCMSEQTSIAFRCCITALPSASPRYAVLTVLDHYR
jgi:hypothetical protein